MGSESSEGRSAALRKREEFAGPHKRGDAERIWNEQALLGSSLSTIPRSYQHAAVVTAVFPEWALHVDFSRKLAGVGGSRAFFESVGLDGF